MHLTFPASINRFLQKPWFLPLLTSVLLLSYGHLRAGQTAKVSARGTKMLVYTPPSYSSNTVQHPLLVFLHGPAETGDDLNLLSLKTNNLYPPKLISSNRWDESLPFIVVSPQLKRHSAAPDQHWSAADIDDVVEFVKRHYRVNPSRIYFTGVSSGATACWLYAATYPAKVAAVIPVSGKADPRFGPRIKDIPVWAFHGENDLVVPPSSAAEMISSIRSSKGLFIPRLTLLSAKGHEGWSELYAGQSGFRIYDWLLTFQSGKKDNVKPYVNAGIDHTIQARAGTHTIAGDFFDWNGKITSVKWRQVHGPGLTLNYTNTAFLQIADLKPGVFKFQLTVMDNNGASANDVVKIVIAPRPLPTSIAGLVLISGRTNHEIMPVTDGMVVDKSMYGREFNVRAIASASVRSVKFTVNANYSTRVMSAPPYLIRKSSASPEWAPGNGNCVICATPFTQAGGRGEAGATFCVRVTFTRSVNNDWSRLSERQPDPEVPIKIRAIDDILVSNMASGNQWVCNGKDIPGATGPIIKPATPGEYFVRQITRAANDVSNLVRLEPKGTKPAIARIDVFPNPAQGYIQVKGEFLPERSSYRILRGGVTVQQGELFSDRKIAINEKLPKGDYVLVVNGKKDDDGTRFVIR